MPYDYLGPVLKGAPHSATAEGNGYGLGVSGHATEFGVAYGDFGWIPEYVSATFYLPARGVSYSISINTDINLMGGPESNFSGLHDRVVEAIFGGERRLDALPE